MGHEHDDQSKFLDLNIKRRKDVSAKKVYKENKRGRDCTFRSASYEFGLLITLFNRSKTLRSNDKIDEESAMIGKCIMNNEYSKKCFKKSRKNFSQNHKYLIAGKKKSRPLHFLCLKEMRFQEELIKES